MAEENKQTETIEIVNFEELKRRLKWEKVKRWGVNKYEKGKEFVVTNVKEHPKEAALIGLLALKYLKGIKQADARKAKVAFEEHKRKYQVYDPSSKRYIDIRREMTPMESLEFEKRRKKGEGAVSVLWDMGLLKY